MYWAKGHNFCQHLILSHQPNIIHLTSELLLVGQDDQPAFGMYFAYIIVLTGLLYWDINLSEDD
uniref:Uncharacterized protein n=1 Tax=Arion vulgaris TaxID=1028688 RepID=A0A0B7ABL0_9EUPU